MRNFDFVNVSTTGGAIALLGAERDRVKILAGGTDLLDELKEGILAPDTLVNIKPNQKLRYIRYDAAEGLRLGALTILSEIEHNATVAQRYPVVTDALNILASPQIRNMATVAGNLCQRPRCWYYRDQALLCKRKGGPICYAVAGENTYHAILGGNQCFIVHPSDLAPVLMAYDGRITLTGPAGSRTVPLEEFFIGPKKDITRENILAQNDVVEEISLPAPAAGVSGAFLKIRERNSWDFATVSVAAVLEMRGARCHRARIVLGAVAPIPWPVPEVDAMLSGATITEKLARQAGEAAVAGARPLGMNSYKVGLAKRLVRRAILTAANLES